MHSNPSFNQLIFIKRSNKPNHHHALEIPCWKKETSSLSPSLSLTHAKLDKIEMCVREGGEIMQEILYFFCFLSAGIPSLNKEQGERERQMR